MKILVSPTEYLDNRKKPIDQVNDEDALKVMLNSHAESIEVINSVLKDIQKATIQMYDHLSKTKDSKIIYAGARTSARIGVQDGAELYPTFGWAREKVGFLIAGNKQALFESIENAEDRVDSVLDEVVVSSQDIVLALAASGNTPYTCKVVEEANKIGALTIGISNNRDGKLLTISKLKICLDTGSEIVAGSTRLKAGTAQNICLNLISTLLMSKFGRVKNGQMSHMVVTNNKLRIRQKVINKLLKDRL